MPGRSFRAFSMATLLPDKFLISVVMTFERAGKGISASLVLSIFRAIVPVSTAALAFSKDVRLSFQS